MKKLSIGLLVFGFLAIIAAISSMNIPVLVFFILWCAGSFRLFAKSNKKEPAKKPVPVVNHTVDIEDDDEYDDEDEVSEDPNRIDFAVAGVTFNNDDGTSRQEILKQFYDNKGYSRRNIELVQYEHKGKPAVYVVAKGKIIGNVPKEHINDIVANMSTLRIYHFRIKINRSGIYYAVVDLFLK